MNARKKAKVTLVSVIAIGAFILTGCSQVTDTVLGTSESSAATESAPLADPTVAPSATPSDPCSIVDSMGQELSNSVGRFIEDPTQDAATALEAEFDIQMQFLQLLVASVESGSASDQLTTDLNNAVAQKDEALSKFTEAQQSGNVLEQGLLLGSAALAAQNAIDSAQSVLTQLSAELQCQ